MEPASATSCTDEPAIVVKMAGFTSGMTKEHVKKCAKQIVKFYTPFKDSIAAIVWDGDPLKEQGSPRDEERGTPACFTAALPILKDGFPEIPFVAAKLKDDVKQLKCDYKKVTRHGSIETGYALFREVQIVGDFGVRQLQEELTSDHLNVLTAVNMDWRSLGVNHVKWWMDMGYRVHYVTIGGGEVVTGELECLRERLDLLWRLPTTRLSGNEPDKVEFYFESKDPTFSILHN